MSFAGDLAAVLRGRNFRRLFATRLTTQLGDGVTTVALTSFVFFSPERQTSASAVAVAFASLLLPYSFVAPFAGVLLDRWSRRQVLVVASGVRAVLLLVVAAMVAGSVTGPAFFTGGLAVLSVNRFFLAALSASLPHVVETRELVMANSVSTTSGTVAALVGAGFGFAAQAFIGKGDESSAVLLGASACASLAAGALATRMHRDLLGPDGASAQQNDWRIVARGVVDGIRHVHNRPAAARALAVIGAHRFVYGILTIATLLLFRNRFNDPADTDAALAGLGTAVAASGAGFALAAVITPEVTSHLRKSTWIVALLAIASTASLTMTLAPVAPAEVVVVAFVMGIAAQGIKICVDATVQESVADDFRGRVFSAYDMLFNVTFVAAAAFAVLTVPRDGYSRPLYAGMAAAYALTAVTYARTQPARVHA